MKQETRVAIIEKEIEVYNKYISLIPIIEKIINQFDNKCINKRFDEALDKAVNCGEKEKRQFYVSTSYGYARQFNITVRAYDIHVREENKSVYPNNYQVSNNSFTYSFPIEDFEITSSGNYRIKADSMIKTLSKIKECLLSQIAGLKDGLIHVNEMIEEMRTIKEKLIVFNNKYDYHMREVMGVNFSLKSNCGYEFSRNDI